MLGQGGGGHKADLQTREDLKKRHKKVYYWCAPHCHMARGCGMGTGGATDLWCLRAAQRCHEENHHVAKAIVRGCYERGQSQQSQGCMPMRMRGTLRSSCTDNSHEQ